MEMTRWIEMEINENARRIFSPSDKVDERALGHLNFYVALRRVLDGRGSAEDIGMMDAINDTLQKQGLVKPGATFLKG